MRTKPIKEKKMSTLKDLCKVIPTSLLREQTRYNAAQRVVRSYAARIVQMQSINNAFAQGKTVRPNKKKVQVRHENS